MSIRAFAVLLTTLVCATPLAAEAIPFDICAESTTWVRPSPEVQGKVWNDPRWKAFARDAYAWTHDFLLVGDPTSGSITGMLKDLSGLWTAQPEEINRECDPRRSPLEVITVWALLHRVVQVTRADNTYTITVEPVAKGFQFVYIHRLNPSAVLRFVTADGRELERWDESAPPNRVKNEVPPGTRIIGRNGEIIRK